MKPARVYKAIWLADAVVRSFERPVKDISKNQKGRLWKGLGKAFDAYRKYPVGVLDEVDTVHVRDPVMLDVGVGVAELFSRC